MKDEDRKKIEELMAGLTCPKGFRCAESAFGNLCKARDFGDEHYLDCLEKSPRECPFAVSFGFGFLCRCPLRVYLARELDESEKEEDGK